MPGRPGDLSAGLRACQRGQRACQRGLRAYLRGLPGGPEDLPEVPEDLPEGPEDLPEDLRAYQKTEGPEGLPGLGRMTDRDGIFLHSTVLCPLSGPLLKKDKI